MSSLPIVNNADLQICRQCGGLCCQGHPGVWVDPERFLDSFGLSRPGDPADLQAVIESLGLVLRKIDDVPVPAPQGGEEGCVFLDDQGCRLDAARRPCQCLALTPSVETLIAGEIRCELPATGSTKAAIDGWRRFWQTA